MYHEKEKIDIFQIQYQKRDPLKITKSMPFTIKSKMTEQ